MSSVLNASLNYSIENNLVFRPDVKQGPPEPPKDVFYLTRADLCEFFLPMKNLKELVQAMARLAAEQDFKN